MKTSYSAFIPVFLLSWTLALAQSPTIAFQNSFGGSLNENGRSAIQTSDGGYIIAGEAVSSDGDLSFHYGTTFGSDAWVIKLDAAGNMQWQKSFGGSDDEAFYSIIQTPDGNYVAAGYTYSKDIDVAFNHGGYDVWVVRIDASGNLIGEKTFGGKKDDLGIDIKQTSDGGFIVAANSYSHDGDVVGHHGTGPYADYWILKLDATGNLEWQKSLGGNKDDIVISVIEVPNQGYVACGYARSTNGDKTVSYGLSDTWIVKLDLAGSIVWQTSVGGSNEDAGQTIIASADDGFIFCGSSLSSDNGISNYGNYDILAGKLNADGVLQWVKNFGGSQLDDGVDIIPASEGGFTIGGSTFSNNFDVEDNKGGHDVWIFHIDENGVIQWEETYGGSNTETLQSLANTTDGGYAICASSESNDKDVSGNHGMNDIWFVQLNPADLSHSITVTSLSATELCQGEDISIGFTATGTYNPGNIFTAQLSDYLGNFAYAVNIGSVTGTNSGIIHGTIPAVDPGNGFHVRVISSDPEITGLKNDADITISCPTPGSLMTTTITQTSAKLKWSDAGCGIGYQVRYKIKGTSPWTKTDVTSLSLMINSLQPETKYIWSVRTQCMAHPNVYSPWASNETFVTQSLKMIDGELGGLQEISVYPNPASDFLNIAVGDFAVKEIIITNMLGELIYRQGVISSHVQIDISNFAPGTYLIYSKLDDKTITKKFIKD